MVFLARDVNDQLLQRGDAGHPDNEKAVYCGAGEDEEVGKQKNGTTGYLIHSCMQGSESMKFQCGSQVSNQSYQYDAADNIPNPSGEKAQQDREQPDNNKRIEKKVGDAVQLGSKLADGVGFSGDPAVQNITKAAEGIDDEKQRGQWSQKQQDDCTCDAYGCNAVWKIQFCGRIGRVQNQDLALSGDFG